MLSILSGVQRFQKEVFPHQREFFEWLTQRQQTPQALFITCSDSRINPNLLTQTEPGQLFLLRNAGNIVPSYGSSIGSGEAATIEYAVAVLKVEHVVICGHWQCGAMNAMLKREEVKELPAVSSWFAHAESTRRIIQQKYSDLPLPEQQVRAVEQNVLVQLNNLRTHPSVAARLADNDLQLHGWVYRIETGEIFAYDSAKRQFRPVAEDMESTTPEG